MAPSGFSPGSETRSLKRIDPLQIRELARLVEDRCGFHLVGQLVEASRVESWSHSRLMGIEMERLLPRNLRHQGLPQRIVDDLLHRLLFTLDSILHQPANIVIERQGGPHATHHDALLSVVKMLQCLLAVALTPSQYKGSRNQGRHRSP